MKKSSYQEAQRAKAVRLLEAKTPLFYGAMGGKKFFGIERDFVLKETIKNLYAPIQQNAVLYFKKNHIGWWGGSTPSGHLLSSQIACLNHLYALRHDKEAVLAILKNISSDFTDVLEINTDRYEPGYIQFEAVSDHSWLNESASSRGSNCTSIDALIVATHKDGSVWLIPIEWKYTEWYQPVNKATEGMNQNPESCKGRVRRQRYTDLINHSAQLKAHDHTVYYYEPFYQLMRQTLWAEQMVIHKNEETIKAENYLHVHVIPEGNSDLKYNSYKCSGKGMEETWRDHLVNQDKYRIIAPEELLKGIDRSKYSDLITYLGTRYWEE